MKLLLIGPQASGKGTQAEFVSKRLNVPHLSSGNMLREEKKSGSELGLEIAGYIDKGALVPDKTIWAMIKKQLEAHPEGWLLDGFPRTASQAATVDKYSAPDKVILLEVPDLVCVERISGRRVCTQCGKEYHVKYKPPKKEGACDLDGAKLVQRDDDYPEAVAKRLADYHSKTAPLIKHYGAKVVTIDGNQGIQEVWNEIQTKLGI